MIRSDGYAWVKWDGLSNGDASEPAKAGAWAGIKTAQIVVNAVGGSTASIKGSMDGQSWFSLHALDLDGGEYLLLDGITDSMLVSIVEDPLYIRAEVAAGGSGADFDVVVGAYSRT